MKRAMASVVLVVLLLSLVPAHVEAAGSLRVGLHTDESTLTPYSYVSGEPGYNLLLFVYDTLFSINEDNVPVPWLVKSYKWSDDGTVLTMDLHTNVKWHDGVALTANDVVFTYEYVKKYVHSRWTGPMEVMDEIKATGTHQVVVKLRERSVGFLYQPLADQPIMPKHIWEKVTDPRTFADATGSGPYKLVDYQPSQYYKFQANESYFKGKPAVDELVMPIIKDATALFTALKANEVQAVSRQLSPELIDDFKSVSGMKVVRGPLTTSYLMLLNNLVPPFDNKDFRRAISLAIDKDKMVDILCLGYGVAGSPGWVHPALPWYLKDLDQVAKFDRAEANKILDGLGYGSRTKDGFRQAKDGSELEFTLLTTSTDPVRVRAAELITDYLKEVGIKIKVLPLDRNSLFSRIGWQDPEFDYSKPRNFELLMWGWSAPIQSWPGRMEGVLHSDHKSVGTLNIQGSGNKDLDAILENIMKTTDEAGRDKLAQDAQRIVAQDTPLIPLFHPDGTYVYNSKAYDGWVFVKGLGIFNKLSFLGKSDPGTESGAKESSSKQVWLYPAAIVVLAAAILAVRRSKKAG